MGINPNIGTTCYSKEGVIQKQATSALILWIHKYLCRGCRSGIMHVSEGTGRTQCMTSAKYDPLPEFVRLLLLRLWRAI